MAENLRAERVGECWSVAWVPAGRWGFRLVGRFFGRKSTGLEWSACLWAKLVGAWLRCGSGAGLAERWLVCRMCIRDGLLRLPAPDRRVCTSRIACVYGRWIEDVIEIIIRVVSKREGELLLKVFA